MSSSDCLGDDTLTEVDLSLVREQERAMLMDSCGVYSTEALLAALDMSRFSDWAEPAGNSCSSREVDCSCGGKRWLLGGSALGCGSAKGAGGSMLLDCWFGDLLERPGPDMGRIAGMVKAAMLWGWKPGCIGAMGEDSTAMAEVDISGGREAAREAAAWGDMRDCLWLEPGAWEKAESGGSREEMAMVLPEVCMEGEEYHAELGGLLDRGSPPAKGLCSDMGGTAVANGDAGAAYDCAASSCACWASACAG